MTEKFRRVFGAVKPAIAMVHLGALPGAPLHDRDAGIAGIVAAARPDLLALQAQLGGTENRIAVARRDYILAVQQYDTELTTIPGRWYHSLFYGSYQPVQNFTISEQAQQAPTVHF